MNALQEFLDSVASNSKLALYHDADCDGVTAATLFIKGAEQLGKSFDYIFTHEGERQFTKKIISSLKHNGITHLVVLDLSMENDKLIDEILSFAKVLVIDHHPTTENIDKDGLSVIKPTTIQPDIELSTMCTAQLVFEVFKGVTDITAYDWLAAAGTLADANYPHQKEFVHAVWDRYHVPYTEDKPFQTPFAKLPKYIDFARCENLRNIPKIRKVLLNSKNWMEAVEGLKEYEPIAEDVTRAVNEYEEKKEEQGIIRFFKVDSPYEISSLVSTIVSFQKDPEHLLIIYKEKQGKMHISARFQKKTINTGRLLKACIEGFPESNAGGHIPASGAGFPIEYWDEFKRRILDLVNKEEFKV